MQTLQSIIQQRVLQQINKQKTEPLQSLNITYYSATKIQLALDEAVQIGKVMQGIQGVHLQKQQSDALISSSKVAVLNVDYNNPMVLPKNEENKQGPQKGRFLVRNEYGSKLSSENKITHSSVVPNKYHKNYLSYGEECNRIKEENNRMRKKEYDKKVRIFNLPKIKTDYISSPNSFQKQLSGQNTAEVQNSDNIKDTLDDNLLQEYNQYQLQQKQAMYYKKQLLLWNKKQRNLDMNDDDQFD
ncbi:unnamed protein product (macronuclear) [Paramecium tetraurelia]|uniref:Uncharacterized protein n=1 Tax=Paramecium tetraurelia TaxID=5888 RepID=A0E5S6_PARTE|nr:uncharacterized protein GSPATT00003505001 [Paramecium tetraurelia]CAK90643.1 unnamed protein product [Paramecium tetraurelia]|eukprot:XP_001458040.1 hypothetical protein (macronuclear) [Paramecium tetraurelia strain d4-2]